MAKTLLLRTHLIHELQHQIQEIEGFSSGTDWVRLPSDIKDRFDNLSTQEISDFLDKIRPAWKRLYPDLSEGIASKDPLSLDTGRSLVAYFHNAGELKAHNTENRERLSEQERRDTHISETEIGPRSKQWSD